MAIKRIISGGQTGADRGGLEAALHCNLPHGGWCPKGRRAENGPIPPQFNLQELASTAYLARTEVNVVNSDGTVIFSYGALEGSSLKTAEFARQHHKPWLHVDLDKADLTKVKKSILKWLKAACPKECVLNVAGSRASKAPLIAGVVKAVMVDVISQVNGKPAYPISDEHRYEA